MPPESLLTQAEIDALLDLVEETRGPLTAVPLDIPAVDPEDGGSIVKRDFSKPDQLPKEESEWLQGEATHAATRVAEGLARWLHLEVRVECVGIELQQYQAFLTALQSPCLVYPLQGGDGTGGALAIDPSIVLAAVDRVLGGTGKARFATRTLTTVELPIGLSLAKRAVAALAEGLSDILTIDREIAAPPALNTRQARFLPADVKCVVLTYAVSGDLSETELRLVFPVQAFITTETKATNHCPVNLPPELPKIGVDVGIRLSETELTLREILALEPGDVVALDGDAGSPVRVEVEGRAVASGSLGSIRDNIAVAIEEILVNRTTSEP